MRPFLLLALLLLPAAAADDDLGRLRLSRLAMEAQIRIGDTLRQKGDRPGARAAYEEALRLGQGPIRGGPAVRLALAWLAAHQDDDGKWDCDGFMRHDPAGDRCDGPGSAHYDVGVTALAVLAFVRTGNAGGAAARRGLDFLRTWQDDTGCFGTRRHFHFMYGHAISTLAFCEAYRTMRDERCREAAQKGLDFLAAARNPYLAWRYEPRGGENDTSVTGWCVMALAAGRDAGLKVDAAAFDGARVWVDKVTDPDFGQVGYNFPGGACARPEGKQDSFPAEKSQAMTAAGIAIRMHAGEDSGTSELIRKGVDLCLDMRPAWNPDDGSIDMYYWFHGTEAMALVGGEPWRRWRAALEEAVLRSQHPAGSGARTGSWDPIGVWGDDGGRVYSTALMALALATEPATRVEPRPGPR